jgi:hypothetical protein
MITVYHILMKAFFNSLEDVLNTEEIYAFSPIPRSEMFTLFIFCNFVDEF